MFFVIVVQIALDYVLLLDTYEHIMIQFKMLDRIGTSGNVCVFYFGIAKCKNTTFI